jgi:LAO/AO transport system kinase
MTVGAEALADALRAGDRRALARAITLVESSRADHRAEAAAVLDAVLGDTGHAIRVGISGTPGAGKSTSIEALGTFLTGQGHRVAVLAVDPSSTRSGGSILGDKTRMEALARDPKAFIRPSPTAGQLGGVARRTREASLLCEAAGFDVILIETVGVGQSETAVAEMVDCFVLLVAPGGGDELQGIKRGILELADLIVVNKADGDLRPAAERALADHRSVLQLLRPKHEGWTVPVLAASAIEGRGVEEMWAEVVRLHSLLADTGRLERLRADQAVAWMWREVRERLVEDLHGDDAVQVVLGEVERELRGRRLSVLSGAQRLLDALRRPPSGPAGG